MVTVFGTRVPRDDVTSLAILGANANSPCPKCAYRVAFFSRAESQTRMRLPGIYQVSCGNGPYTSQLARHSVYSEAKPYETANPGHRSGGPNTDSRRPSDDRLLALRQHRLLQQQRPKRSNRGTATTAIRRGRGNWARYRNVYLSRSLSRMAAQVLLDAPHSAVRLFQRGWRLNLWELSQQ